MKQEIYKKESNGTFLSAVLRASSTPMVELIGQEIHEFAESKIETWKEKQRQKNLAEHMKKAQERIAKVQVTKDCFSTVAQATFFSEWVNSAQDIDPRDKALSKLWQDLLVAISVNNLHSEVMFAKLKLLSPFEADVLLEFNNNGKYLIPINELEYFSLEQLYQKGFVKKCYKCHIMFIASIISYFTVVITFRTQILRWFALENTDLVYASIVISFLFMIVYSRFCYFGDPKYSLAGIGKEFIKQKTRL